MLLTIDFHSEEAIYLQLCNQIILSIATDRLKEGDTLPSVRELAENIGINMHTVNKAYSLLKDQGFVKVDRRKGTFIAVDRMRVLAKEELRDELRVSLARSMCRGLKLDEVHQLVDEIWNQYTGEVHS